MYNFCYTCSFICVFAGNNDSSLARPTGAKVSDASTMTAPHLLLTSLLKSKEIHFASSSGHGCGCWNCFFLWDYLYIYTCIYIYIYILYKCTNIIICVYIYNINTHLYNYIHIYIYMFWNGVISTYNWKRAITVKKTLLSGEITELVLEMMILGSKVSEMIGRTMYRSFFRLIPINYAYNIAWMLLGYSLNIYIYSHLLNR